MQLLKINKIIILFNSEKVPCHEGMPVKLIKLSAIATDSHLGKNINQDINLNSYLENAKIANIGPIFKRDERTKVKNYRPVSHLNIFLKFMKDLCVKI